MTTSPSRPAPQLVSVPALVAVHPDPKVRELLELKITEARAWLEARGIREVRAVYGAQP